MRLDSPGNLGLGVTPSAWSGVNPVFEFGGTGVSASLFQNGVNDTWFSSNAFFNGTSFIYKATGTATQYHQSGGQHRWFTAPSGTAGDAISFTQAMSLTAAGDLLVGQTSLSQTTVGFSVTPSGIVSTAMAASTSAANSYHLYSTGAGAYRFYVGLDGTINATSVVISAISDLRLKENVRDIEVGLDEIMALKPRRFDWKEGKGKDIKNDRGFIAQEFEEVFPNMIDISKESGENGETYKAIKTSVLVPMLVKAIQELKSELDTLKNK
jgi:hypothetical protein